MSGDGAVSYVASVIIPFHQPDWIFRAVESCRKQTVPPEIVVVPNGGMENDQAMRSALGSDCVWAPCGETGKIGALKRHGFMSSSGRWLIELDHDDILDPRAVERLLGCAAINPRAIMLYSDCAYRDWPQPWDRGYGWGYYTDDAGRRVTRSPDPLPQNLCRIWYAPDHVRAYRSDWYRSSGGHDSRLAVADDQDLSIRAWLHGPGSIVRVPDCLYEYQVHPNQTSARRAAEIQSAQWAVYDRYVERLAVEWARREQALALDMGGGLNPRDGYIPVDKSGAAIRADLDADWPFGDRSCGAIRMSDVAEHLVDNIHTMNEAWRCLIHGGFLFIRVPSTDGRGAFRDPTHKSFWNIESFLYYTQRQYRRYIEPACRCRFQALRVRDYVSDGVLYTEAHLLALKPGGQRFHGVLEI